MLICTHSCSPYATTLFLCAWSFLAHFHCGIFFLVKFSLLRKLEVAITIIFTIGLATSDSPEVMLSQQWVDITYPVCTKYFFKATNKVCEAVWLLREEIIRLYCGSSCNPTLQTMPECLSDAAAGCRYPCALNVCGYLSFSVSGLCSQVDGHATI